MTIKRRLFFSNILMLVMPIILTVIMFSCMIFILMGITGISDFRSDRDGNIFFSAMSQVDDISQKISNDGYQNLQSDTDELNKLYKDYDITLTVYDGDILIFPSSADGYHTTPSETDYGLVIKDNNAVYRTEAGDYTFILSSTEFSPYPQNNPFSNYFYFGIFVFIFAIVMVFIINYMLTRSATKKITTPIEILVSGVHELRDGNLNYRIQYDYNDEFKQVCNDFNEMAQHLFEMVAARQKDEENRKELIAGISHDLRTPLTSIKAYIEGIEKGVASTPQIHKRYFDTIKSKTEDLEHIINQLFLFSKLDVGEFPLHIERVEIGEILKDFLRQAVSEYKEKGLSLSLVNNSYEMFADIDVVQLRSVLNNILENSIKYKVNDNVKSEIIYAEKDGNIVISITDDGPGVPKESIDKLFDVFYRSDTSRKDPSSGSGLGLAIAKKIIERSGGTIHAENALEGGLTIIISLPKSGGSI